MRLRRSLIIFAIMSLQVACHGLMELDDDSSNSHADAIDETSSPPQRTDTGTSPGRDSGDNHGADVWSDDAAALPDTTSNTCQTVSCGSNAECRGGQCHCLDGFVGHPDTGCRLPDPCDAITCSRGATCIEGTCRCDAGFTDDGQGGCIPQSPGDTAIRTREQVCQRWNEDRFDRATTLWQQEPENQCDWGVLHPEVHTDALRRATLYRWLVGLGPLTSADPQRITTQACATTLAARGQGLTHSITADFPCYSQEAASGAGTSNIAMGVSRPSDSVDLYIGDIGVPSLGHRRWIFNPGMGETAFGQRGSYSCMYAFGGGGSDNPDYVAYPAPGFFPAQALMGTWSFSSSRYGIASGVNVNITRVDDGSILPVTNVYIPGGGYGQPALGWDVSSRDLQRDVEYEVRITGLTGSLGDTVVYRVTITHC
jgi:hypothetical protein